MTPPELFDNNADGSSHNYQCQSFTVIAPGCYTGSNDVPMGNVVAGCSSIYGYLYCATLCDVCTIPFMNSLY